VLAAHQGVIAAMRPGVSWTDMHTLAYEQILGGLKAGGLLVGEVGDMIAAEVGGLFMPHGECPAVGCMFVWKGGKGAV
jgi:Xaa-Pro dipeptidase